MNISEVFIRRPVMTTLVMVATVLFGAFGYMQLPTSELPAVDFPTISVSASLPGADPETMASAVATPLESQFSTIAGIDQMTSTSSLGSTRITLQFKLDRNIDAAAQDVQAAISAAQRQLPDGMPNPPTLRKVNPADSPILFLMMSSKVLPLSEVDRYAESILSRRLSTIDGVAQVNVYGSQKYAVRIQLNPEQVAARGLGIDEVTAAAQAANVNNPTGALNGPTRNTVIRANGQLVDAEAFRRQIVAWRDGAPVRFGDIGDVVDSVENDQVASWSGQNRAIVLSIQRQPGANTIAVVDAINKVLPAFQQQLPASISFDVLYDRSQSIRASVADVQFTLVLAAALVVLVIFLFLRTLSATIIPSLALPIAVIGTFAGMAFLGYSLDNLSLMALTLAVGFVVDDAIVMLENIMRHIENGERPFDAALKGSREIAFTILSMTVSLAAVFIPVLFMGGIVGRLLHEFAVTIVIAIIVSGVVSVTLTPMLCSRMIRAGHDTGRQRAILAWSERVFTAMEAGYERTLRIAMIHHRAIFAVFLLSIVATVALFNIIPKDFLPSGDTGQIIAMTEGPNGISIADMSRHQQAAVAVIMKDPNVAAVMSSVGAGGSRTTVNAGTIIMRLKDRSERSLNADQIIQELRPKLAQVAGFKVYLQNPPAIRVGGQLSKASYQYTLQDLDLPTLYAGATKLQNALATAPGFQDVTSDLDLSTPTLSVKIDRDRAASLGITPQQVQTALSSAFGGVQISTIYTSSDQYEVVMELQKRYQQDETALQRLYLRSSSGNLVPLTAVTQTSHIATSLTENHLGQLPAVTISFNLAPGVALSQAMRTIEQTQENIRLAATISTSFQGTAQAFQSSMSSLGLLLGLAILVVYVVLGILYESFIHPLTILSGLPSAAVGALLTLWLFGLPLTLYAFVGMIMLIGIVKKNAIMMIDFALERERGEGMAPDEAIFRAAIIRFRPIMMTTMAALMGTLPIAIGFGEGGEVRRPLGLAVVGGLILSQLLTLYITPVLYVYLDRLGKRFGGRPADVVVAAGE
ncbi:acriflavine resistance protein B [Parvibaculum sedimenti]|uniref:Acriflavine resistance protein B n=1 Tax=Parvibaculum sedimenti TaxID=2608632 RepID=A0A6N6VP83_9HYPH|nr:efflux RND transporter permease subunit [Parvibaculum sedimenti]KAB7741172.1 acriflavine resistance protein B [Parvibaculum sedimenti]